jgi:hypothetical protein
MPWKVSDVYDERVKFVAAPLAAANVRSSCSAIP